MPLTLLVQSQLLTKKVVDTIMHSRKSLLFKSHEIWVKNQNPNFDVTMGSFDGGMRVSWLVFAKYSEK